ncbi:MAG: nucleotidyl transferase AbiEii/AbiGii toxin family protein [Candidatus Colwellbacteria bacterium]
MTLDTGKHKNILVKILKDIYTDATIGPFVGFKGGTAAYLFYELSRASLDLDFDLLDETKEDAVFAKVEEIAKQYGKIKEHRKKRFNLFLMLSYEDEAPNIKIEINLREFGSQYEVKSFLGISMKVMIQKDMFAHKLVAMYERMGKANRDIFDVWFFGQKDWPINKGIIEKRTKMSFGGFLKKCIEALEKLPNRDILAGMGELLDGKQKVWVKTKLKDEVVFQLKLRLENESGSKA